MNPQPDTLLADALLMCVRASERRMDAIEKRLDALEQQRSSSAVSAADHQKSHVESANKDSGAQGGGWDGTTTMTKPTITATAGI